MYEIAKHEFIKWLNLFTEQKDLSPAESNILSIVLSNFDEVASKGTASGARANYLISKIEDRAYSFEQCSLDCRQETISVSSSIQHLQRLEVQSFRGFSTHLSFDFSKQYTTFFGSNGSGKSSLCDALEYCILGTVQEATTRRIILEEFLKNKKKELFIPPELYTLLNGEETLFECDFEKYQFSFIEKNRIDRFSHINASTPGEKAERLAILFGLTEFSDFVKGFTESLDNKIQISNAQIKIKEESDKRHDDFVARIKEITEKIDSYSGDYQRKITTLGSECPQNLDEAIKYLQSDDGSGRIKELDDAASKERKPEYDLKKFNSLVQLIISLDERVSKLGEIESKILSLCVNSNLVEIYSAVVNLTSDVDHTVCPACQTPVVKTEKNPFIYAKEELSKLGEYTRLKQLLREAQKVLLNESITVNKELSNNKELLSIFGLVSDDLLLPTPDSIDHYLEKTMKDSIQEVLSHLLVIVRNQETYAGIIIQQNAAAKEINDNNTYTKEANRLREVLHALIEIRGRIDTLAEERKEKTDEVKKIIEERETIEKRVKEENELNNRKLEYISAYKYLLAELKRYQVQLPISLANSLSEKIKNYYNVMNKGDASFELIENIIMPISPEDNIVIKFKDGIEVNALQVLSEGHVKLLGLAILLAKAKETDQRFLILDDIVNAIDDGHRSGVASLLFQDDDFKELQIILTCHSEPFMKRIEDFIQIGRRDEKITRYVFITPVEDEAFRGIVVDYSNPKEPLELAKKDLQKNDFKDAAQKCRQATESLVNKLWKKLSSQFSVQISVALRTPDSIPDLSSVVDGIIGFLAKHEKDTIGVLSILREIKTTYNWFLLNKGTHYEDDQFQFEATDVLNLCSLLERLDIAIAALKIRSFVLVEG